MSYNAYQASNHSYSPYYQQATGQDGRTQYNDQPRGNNAYQNDSYQPLSAYQSRQVPPSTTPQPTNAATAYNDSGYGSGAAGGRHDSRAGYIDGRSSVDTTALGNLAYASSLGRDNSNLQQSMSYNRAQNPTGYSTLASYGSNTGGSNRSGTIHQRTNSNGPAPASREENPRAQSAITSPSLGFSANGVDSAYQSQQTPTNTSQAQLQYNGTHFPQSMGEAYPNQYSNSSRPSSGQAVRRPPSTTGSQGISPTAAPDQNVRNHSDGNLRRVSTSARPDKPRAPTPQQQTSQKYPPASSGPRTGTYTLNAQTQPVASGTAPKITAQSSTTSAQTPSRDTPHNPSQPSNSGYQVNGQKSQDSASRTIQNPTTVNPSQVFNDAEYQRRQAAAAAEAEAARKRAEDERIAALPKNVSSSIPESASSHADAAKKDQMELEMKQMIEKMRDYKSKDPSLFSQIWEQVKKGQPAQRGSPQVATQGSSTSPVVINDQLLSPAIHLPPESEIPAANGEPFPPNFDRGRFPAQRRRRGGANHTPEKKQATPKGSAKSISTDSNVDPGNQTMQRAMTEFHKNTGSPMPSGQTPRKEQQTRPPSATEPTGTPAPSNTAASTPTPSATAQARTQPPPSKAGGTYWPENKKRQLAEAARVALTTGSQNAGKPITTDEIHHLLDQNPSYTQMCEILEYRGFVIDRGQFARLLLHAVPDLGASTPRPLQPPAYHGLPSPSPAPPTIGLPSTSTAQAPSSQTTLQAGQGRLTPYSVPQPQPTNDYNSPYGHQNQPGQHPVPQAQMTPASVSSKEYRFTDPRNPNQLSQYPAPQQANVGYGGRGILYPHPSLPQPPPPQPPSASNPSKNNVRWSDIQNRSTGVSQPTSTRKQDMARKRSFGEIVDLTQGLSDEDDGPLSKRPRVNDASEIRVHTAGRGPDSGTATPSSIKDATALEEYRYKPTGKEEYLRANDIILPMNKRQDALRRSSYNPKTIARDILLAIGKHPTMAPLNSHLDILRERFAAVNYESDLSTFRWDLVDPGGPPPVVDTSVDEDTHQSRRISGKDPRSSLAVVVKGSGPFRVEPGQGRRRNEGFKPTRGGRAVSSNRPIPSSTKVSANPQTPQNTTVTSQGITRTSLSDSGFARFVHNDLPVMLNNITGSSGRTPATQSFMAATPASSAAKVRVPGRGRPPGAKNKNPRPDKGIHKKSRDTPSQDASANDRVPADTKDSPIQIRAPTPIQTQTAPIRTPSSSLKTRPRISTTPVRFSSLRNAVTPIDGIAVVIPSRSPSVMGNSPAVSVAPSAGKTTPYSTTKTELDQSPAPAPSYKVYKCHWDKCPAELHNIETLRKHVRKHRSGEDFERGPHLCLWSGCSRYDRTSPLFGSMEEWDRHVVSQHVEAARIPSSGDESPAEASDFLGSPVASKAKVIRRGGPGSVVPSSSRPMVVLRS